MKKPVSRVRFRTMGCFDPQQWFTHIAVEFSINSTGPPLMIGRITIANKLWSAMTFHQKRVLFRAKYNLILYAWWNGLANAMHEIRMRVKPEDL